MSVLDKTRAAAGVADSTLRSSCLPFCFWRGSRRTESRGAEAAPGKLHRRRRFRLRLSWLAFSWAWLRKSGKRQDAGRDCTKTTGKQRRGRLLLLLKTSLQAKKALASVVVSGDSSGLLPATVSSFGDAKKQNRSKPRTMTADGAAPSGTRSQPQASTTATGTRGSTTSARLGTNQPRTTATDEPAMAATGRIWRAPSRRHSLQQLDRTERPAGASGLWTAATTLGVIVLFGRVTAVVFLCSCLYGARFVRAWAAGASAKSSGVAGVGSSRQFGELIGVAAEKASELCVTEELKKKVVMAGLLQRTGKRRIALVGDHHKVML